MDHEEAGIPADALPPTFRRDAADAPGVEQVEFGAAIRLRFTSLSLVCRPSVRPFDQDQVMADRIAAASSPTPPASG
ncbi:MAG: hypothetical protein ACRYFY_02150 [Janthinobacterium lividum]